MVRRRGNDPQPHEKYGSMENLRYMLDSGTTHAVTHNQRDPNNRYGRSSGGGHPLRTWSNPKMNAAESAVEGGSYVSLTPEHVYSRVVNGGPVCADEPWSIR